MRPDGTGGAGAVGDRASGLPVGDLPDHARVATSSETEAFPTGGQGSEAVGRNLEVPASALAIGAHPDDVEFGCGATLARWADSGCRVHHLVLTDGSKGSWEAAEDVAALVRTRQEECRAAAAVLDGRGGRGADRVVFLGEIDGELVDDERTRRAVVGVLRRLRPEVVLAHDPWRRYRLHPDHRAAGFLSLDSVVAARDPLFFADIGPGPHRPARILLFEADEPNHVEDADGFADRKIEALLSHRSQHTTTMGIDGIDDSGRATDAFHERVHRQLSSHGTLAGLALGEAFHLIDRV